MSTPFYGKAYIIDNAPTPAAPVNISSSTNATPIVVTTAAAHGLQTGVAVIIHGHLVNTNANGIWRVHVLTSTTFRLLNFDATDSTGNGVGGATGTSQSLMLPGFNIGEDAVDDINASLLNVPNEALGNMVAWLAYRVFANLDILAGGNAHLNSGSTMTSASGSAVTLAGTFASQLQSTFTGGTSNPGLSATGGSGGAVGVQATGTNSNAGVQATGHGGAPGVTATGGSSGGAGVVATGAGGGNGVQATGQGAGTGVIATGGATGEGLYCEGNGGSAALHVDEGHAIFTGAQPSASANPGQDNLLCGTNIAKAWGTVKIEPDGGGGITVTVLDGYNLSAVALVGGTSNKQLSFTFTRAMDDGNYSVTFAGRRRDTMAYVNATGAAPSTTAFRISLSDLAGGAIDDVDLTLAAHTIMFQVFARQ